MAEKQGRVEKCWGCEDGGPFACGVPGVLKGVLREGGTRANIERCDMCRRYHCDADAALALTARQGGVVWQRADQIFWQRRFRRKGKGHNG